MNKEVTISLPLEAFEFIEEFAKSQNATIDEYIARVVINEIAHTKAVPRRIMKEVLPKVTPRPKPKGL